MTSSWYLRYCQHMVYLLYITSMFDRCRRSSAAVTPVKYERDSKNLTGRCKIKNFLFREINERSFSNRSPRSCTIRLLVSSAGYTVTHGDVMLWGRFPYYWPFVTGLHWWSLNWASNAELHHFSALLLSLLNKQSSCRWFETPEHSYEITVIKSNFLSNISEPEVF